MSIAPSVALPEAAAVRVPRVAASRRALLFGAIAITEAVAFVLAVVSFAKPIGSGDALLPAYADVAAHRTYVWAFFLAAGVNLVIGVCTAAVAAWILTPARGSRLGTVGGALVWLGAAAYAVGIGGWAAVLYAGSDASAIGTAGATRLLDHVGDDTAHMAVVPLGGAVVVALGSLVLCAGLWRAATMPRPIVAIVAASTVATLVLPPDGLAGVVAEGASSLATGAIGWYAWRPWAGRPAA